MTIRVYQTSDLAAVYEICLKTGDSGEDASTVYDDPKILGHFYAGPYVTLEPELAFVLEDDESVCGYILGARDSQRFYQRFRDEWLPDIRRQVPEPDGAPASWTPSERLYHRVHHPDTFYPDALKAYPSHLHIDLLPRAQRQGNGTRLMQTLLSALKDAGSPAVHLGMGRSNTRAFKFYQKMGFQTIDGLATDDTLYLGKQL